MIKVALLGDSIRQIGYGNAVCELLGDEYSVFQPNDNCRFVKYTLRCVLHEWRSSLEESDVIHWNNGLWDICNLGDGVFTTYEEYRENMLRVATALKKYGKAVIFATTTPVRDGHPYNSNDVIKEYNDRIVPELINMGIIINDLHKTVVADVNKYILESDMIHLSEEGINACATQVAEIIRATVKDARK